MSVPGSATVLVVEPDETARSFLVSTLEDAGYRVVACEDGGDGLAAAASRIDLIVTERDLPGMDGLKFVIEVRKMRSPRHIPVLMVAGRVRKLDSSFIAGVDEAMCKPIAPDTLLRVCRSLLAVRDVRNAIERRNAYQRALHDQELKLR